MRAPLVGGRQLCDNPEMPRAPNLVLVMLDQLRVDCLGAYGSAICKSPLLDAIAAQGMRFDRAYTPTGICSPARASLFTGKYAHRHGILNNVHGPDAIATELRAGETTFPALLRDAGYRTAYVGKWHVGRQRGPQAAGFTDVGATDQYLERDLANYRRKLGLDPDGPLFGVDVNTEYPPLSARADRPYLPFFPVMGRDPYPLEATPQGYFLDSALKLLENISKDGQPFFCVLSFIGPHWPHSLPEPYWSMYDPAAIPSWANFEEDFQDKPQAQQSSLRHYGVDHWSWKQWAPAVAAYFGSVTMHDEMVGRFVSALDGMGLGDDTMLVITADHGDSTGSHRLFNKGPWMYEEVYRLPLMARWPGVVAPGSHRSEYVSSMDLMSTMLDAAGVPAPDGAGSDSLSLLPLLRGEAAPEWRQAFVAEFHGDEFGLYSQRMLHAGRYKFVFNPHSIDELYDLQADPHELVNLAPDSHYEALKDDFESRLQEWMRRTEDPLWYLSYNYLA